MLGLAVVRVEHRKRAAGRVGGGDGGADDDGSAQVVGRCLGRIEDLAAADAHHDVTGALTRDVGEPRHLGLRALATEVNVDRRHGAVLEAHLDLLANALAPGGRVDDERRGAEGLDIAPETS